eukprot:CAMPEP_0171835742 /NCGR_PEP_ID=MMETSP0992-20121227/11165_1 /TAXON_ID=483369 /ORGANISM="non described non described, Strain CCMP2098" /LENGTH=256 /DNA_ID=CAMNT_0012451625 /DNA_START=227 /DNA_END=994 /DNA_ORIENTATION=+
MNKTKKSSAIVDSCANCDAPGRMTCSKCKLAKYCSRSCQRHHWGKGEHKRFCLTPAERTTKGAAEAAAVPTVASKSAGGDKECVICLECLATAETVTLPCKHTFHAECVSSMRKLTQNQACPVCRADLPPGPKRAFEEAIRPYLVIERRLAREGRAWTALSKEERDAMDAVIALWRGAASEGQTEAQYNLGLLLQKSRGVAKDEAEAAKWFRKAAKQGLARAQSTLGVALMQGIGVANDEVEAAKWYRKAAEQGHA